MQNETTTPLRNLNGTIQRVIIHPDPILAAEQLSITIVARFFSRVRKTDSCWLWDGTRDEHSGVIGRGGGAQGTIMTRRLSWLIYYGPTPEGNRRIRNSCGNAFCVNPDHLAIRGGEQKPPIDWMRVQRLLDDGNETTDYTTQDPTLPKGFSNTFRERFWGKVRKTETCWLWTGAFNQDGYGCIGRGRNQKHNIIGAHVASWIIHKGSIKKGLYVCHDCPGGDNRACVNPAHLYLASTRRNTRDAAVKYQASKGMHWNATVTTERVAEIRRLHAVDKLSIGAIARQFSLSRAHVSRIVNNLSRKVVVGNSEPTTTTGPQVLPT